MAMKVKTEKRSIPLPDGIVEADLKYPDLWDKKRNRAVKNYVGPVAEFEIWYTERFGWCIPTLHIRNASRAQRGRTLADERTYAVSLTGQVVRMGLGPHVLARHTVYVLPARQAELKKFLDLREEGLGKAGDIRDRISTRRANSRGLGLLGF